MNWVRWGAYCPVACVFLIGCARTELSLDPSIDEASAAGSGGRNATTAGTGGRAVGSNSTGASAAGGTPGMPKTCADTTCGSHESCDPKTISCDCSPGFSRADSTYACLSTVCKSDADCDDRDPCDGNEVCDSKTNSCQSGVPVSCPAHERCGVKDGAASCECLNGYATNGAGTCLPECDVPLAPVISVIDDAEILHFTVAGDLPIQTAIQPASAPPENAAYLGQPDVPLTGHSGLTRVLARVSDASCVRVTSFDAVYDVRATCAPAEHAPNTTAIPKDDPQIVGWATSVQDFRVGPGVTQLMFTNPNAALGPAQGTSTAVVSLGDAGEISLSFATPISNGDSWDLTVFENAFSDSYLELGFVEVSSDGKTFLRFDSAFLGVGPASTSYIGDARKICGIAGSYAAGFGTPFDLDALRNQPLARSGAVDLNAIRYVRVIDIVGDGNTLDSFGRPIFDPNPSAPTAGFDLDAIAGLHAGAKQ